MKVTWQAIREHLVDPVDRSALAVSADGSELVSESGNRYPVIDGQPILLPEEGLEAGGWRFDPISVSDADRSKPKRSMHGAHKVMKNLLRNDDSRQSAGSRLVELLSDLPGEHRPRVLIVGGATVGHGAAPLVDDDSIDVISLDVYPTSQTTMVADAHRIPLTDCSVSAVWIQAVLEHVYRPEDVVAEIVRVLEPSGLVYAETPFMQPVHEGAYDYTRYSKSGHRLLFSRFVELRSGTLGGPGSVLVLSIRGLVGGLTRSRRASRIAYALFSPLALLDRLVPSPWRADFCTGSYFLGHLSGEMARPFNAIVVYDGAG